MHACFVFEVAIVPAAGCTYPELLFQHKNLSLARWTKLVAANCRSVRVRACHENFGPENFGPQDQNFQQKYWSVGPFFFENFGPPLKILVLLI